MFAGLICHGCNEEKNELVGANCFSTTGTAPAGKFNDASYVDSEGVISPQPEGVDDTKPIPIGDNYYAIWRDCLMTVVRRHHCFLLILRIA